MDIDLEKMLVPWLGRTMKMIDNYIHDVFEENNVDLTKTQWIVLKVLNTKNGVAQQELAFLTGRDKTSLTRLINTMEKKNLVARISSKLDRRINNIHVTKKGERVFKETLPIVVKAITSLQENILEEDIDKTIHVIKKVQANLNQKSTKSCNSN